MKRTLFDVGGRLKLRFAAAWVGCACLSALAAALRQRVGVAAKLGARNPDESACTARLHHPTHPPARAISGPRAARQSRE